MKMDLSVNKTYIGHLVKSYLKQHPSSPMVARKNSFVSFCQTFNHLAIEQLTSQALRVWFNDLREEFNFTNKTLHCIKINMNSFMKWLVQEKYLTSNPILPIKFKVHKSLQKPRVIMTEAELQDTLKKLSEADFEAFRVIYVLCHTGARKNEIRPLKWSQVDFGTGFINLYHTKNGEDRSIAMSEQLRKFLDEMPRDSEYVFLNRKGLLISPWQVDNALAKLQKKFPDMKKFRSHDLRHSFAYNYLLKGGNMYSLQQILGTSKSG